MTVFNSHWRQFNASVIRAFTGRQGQTTRVTRSSEVCIDMNKKPSCRSCCHAWISN